MRARSARAWRKWVKIALFKIIIEGGGKELLDPSLVVVTSLAFIPLCVLMCDQSMKIFNKLHSSSLLVLSQL